MKLPILPYGVLVGARNIMEVGHINQYRKTVSAMKLQLLYPCFVGIDPFH